MKRIPAVAGTFYPEKPEELGRMVDELLGKAAHDTTCKAIMVPHAGLVYSGSVAGAVYAKARIPKQCILIGPNHSGFGSDLALYPAGEWHTPLGVCIVPKKLVEKLSTLTPLEIDPMAHSTEHSLEVQLPFLQRIRPDLELVPILIANYETDILIQLGKLIGQLVQATKEEILLIGSTDMTHYEPRDLAEKKDHLAIEEILKGKPEVFVQTIHNQRISMCGWAPMTIILSALREMGESRASLVSYRTSADQTHDTKAVVGYAGMVFE
jgi:MEMO1 family protein